MEGPGGFWGGADRDATLCWFSWKSLLEERGDCSESINSSSVLINDNSDDNNNSNYRVLPAGAGDLLVCPNL